MGIFSFMQKSDLVEKKPAQKTTEKEVISSLEDEPIYPNTIVGKPKIDYNKHFEELLKSLNISGPDFFEFIKALALKEGQPLTEEQKYKDVYNTFSILGLSIEKLLETGNFYIQKCNEEEKSFLTDYENNYKKNVLDKKAQYEKLQSEIIAKQKEAQELIQKATENENLLAIEKSGFKQALSYQLSVLNTHITNIKTYLNGTTK